MRDIRNVPGLLISMLCHYEKNGPPTVPAGVDKDLLPSSLAGSMRFIESLRWVKNPHVINAALRFLNEALSKGEVSSEYGFMVSQIKRYQKIEKQPLPDGVKKELIPEGLRENLRLRGYLIKVSIFSGTIVSAYNIHIYLFQTSVTH